MKPTFDKRFRRELDRLLPRNDAQPSPTTGGPQPGKTTLVELAQLALELERQVGEAGRDQAPGKRTLVETLAVAAPVQVTAAAEHARTILGHFERGASPRHPAEADPTAAGSPSTRRAGPVGATGRGAAGASVSSHAHQLGVAMRALDQVIEASGAEPEEATADDEPRDIGDGHTRRRSPTGQPDRTAPAADAVPTGPATLVHTTHNPANAASDDRTIVGVGERVNFTSDRSGSWTATAAKQGARTRAQGRRFTWFAPGTAANVTITFDAGDGTAARTVAMSVIPPSGVEFILPSPRTFAAGRQGAGMTTLVRLRPYTVDFSATSWKEMPGPATGATGFFTGGVRLPSHRPTQRWLPISVGNGGPTDDAAFWGFPSPWSAGRFQWVIPNRYRVDGESGEGHEFTTVVQSCTIEGPPTAGRTTVRKGDASVTREPGRATTLPDHHGRRAREQGPVSEGDQEHRRPASSAGLGRGAGGTSKAPVPTTPHSIIRNIVAAHKPDVAWAYLRKHEPQFLTAIERTLLNLAVPTDQRLHWIRNGVSNRFRAALQTALGTDVLFIKLPELVHPADPWYSIDQYRTLTEGTPGVTVDGKDPVGPMVWSHLAGVALGADVMKALTASLARMVPRFLIQIDVNSPAKVSVADLVTSHPMDRVTANLLVDPSVVDVSGLSKPKDRGKGKRTSAARKDARQPDDPKQFKWGVRLLNNWRWLGSTDPALWNWLEAIDPTDATPEEVAATLWMDHEATKYAYGIRQSGPYFRLEPGFARRFSDASEYAFDAKHKDQDNALDLAGSVLANDAAIAEAADEQRVDKKGRVLPPDLEILRTTLQRSQRQITRAKAFFDTPRLWTLVHPALNWVRKTSEYLVQIPDHRLAALTPVIEGQSHILFEAVGAITEIGSMEGAQALQLPSNPVFELLREYAIVIGESHLIDSARAHLRIAREAKAGLPLALLEASVRDAGVAVDDLAAGRDKNSPIVSDAQQKVRIERHRIAGLRAQQAAGKSVDPGIVANVAATLKEQAIEARASSLYDQLSQLANAASDSSFGFFETFATVFDADIRALPGAIRARMNDLRQTVVEPHRKNKQGALARAGQDVDAQTAALNQSARMTERSLAAFIKRHDLGNRMRSALAVIENQQDRTAVLRIVTQIVILIGAGVAGGIVGNMVAGAVRGALVADAATASLGMLRAANAAGTIAGLTVDAGINTGVQLAVQGGSAKEAFLGNFLGSAAVRVALTPLNRAAQTWGRASQDLANVSRLNRSLRAGKVVAYQGAVLSTMVITGAATDYVIHRVLHSDKPPTEKQAIDWAIQGGSMAIGIFVGRWAQDFESHAVRKSAQFGQVVARARGLRRLSREVERTGDKDAALELLIKRQELLQEEAKVIDQLSKLPPGTVSPEMLETLRIGNAGERNAVKDAAFAQVPLRLAGLEPDDASGTIWTGATEDIGIALHQAHRLGLHVDVLSHDSAARQWRIRLEGQEITILETKLTGQPRAAKKQPSEADRNHARRYAESAEFMQERWEAKVKAEIDSRDVVEVDHLQAGYAYAGVVNQATLPAQGKGLDSKLIVYGHKGTLSKRGGQELGQPPDKFDAPGVRTTEQAPKDAPWATSDQLARSLDLGRLETQTPAYRGKAIDQQTREQATPDDPWKAPSRKFRVKISDGARQRWVYADHIDVVGGLGPGSLKQVEQVVDPGHLSKMMEGDHPQLLQGDDVDYIAKVKAGRVLIWGGTPTGAWAAEPVMAKPGGRATVLGDTRPPTDWQALFGEYNEIKETIAVMGDQAPAGLKDRVKAMEVQIAEAHAGSKIPRNRKPGATYEKPPRGGRGPGEVQIEFGSPSKISPTDDGRVLVTIGSGENARSSIYDQIVIAHGQDPGAPGGPAAMLGEGARLGDGATPGTKELGDVPAGTIALRPKWGPTRDDGTRDILGLESIDPPGITLKGAAFASKRMSPWVQKSERAAFEAAVKAASDQTATTRDGAPISDDSRDVSAGVEVQRDRIPRLNETVAGRMRLPTKEATLDLDPADPSKWDDQVREFFAVHLRATDRWIKVKRFGDGRSKAIVYHVSVDGTEVGVFKLFDGKDGAKIEHQMLDKLKAAKLRTLDVVDGRGTAEIDPSTGFTGAILMDRAKGTSVKQMIDELPRRTDAVARRQSIDTLEKAVKRVALGLAEMHGTFGRNVKGSNKPEMMTKASKERDVNYLLDRSFSDGGRDTAKVKDALGADFDRVRTVVEGRLATAFMDAEIPATAYHGDANIGNFTITGDRDPVGMFDVGTMQYSLSNSNDPSNALGIKTGAADVARFLGSLETLAPGKLDAPDLAKLRAAFKKTYFSKYRVGSDRHQTSRTDYDQAELWYRVEMEVMVIMSDPAAKPRLLRLLGLGAGGSP